MSYLQVIFGLILVGVVGCGVIVLAGVMGADESDDPIGDAFATAGNAMILLYVVGACIVATLAVWLWKARGRTA